VNQLLDRAFELATEQVAWSRRHRHGWIRPGEVYEALEERAPPNPTWQDAIGALAHAWLESKGRQGGRQAAN